MNVLKRYFNAIVSEIGEGLIVRSMMGLLIGFAVATFISAGIWTMCRFLPVLNCIGPSMDTFINLLGHATGGILIAIGLVFLNRRAKAMDKSAEASLQAAEASLQLAEASLQENQQTLFNVAIGHLGHGKESVRLGGIYALYELATDDTTKEKYRETVHKILCAHIRSKTNEEEYKKKYVNKDPESKSEPKPSTEIQSLLDILTKEPKCCPFQGLLVDFSGAQLQSADLISAQLQFANLISAQLQSADLSFAQLESAHLRYARLQFANLSDAHLQSAILIETHLQFANLSDAHLQSANLTGAHLQSTHLCGTQLQSAGLSDAHLQSADLRAAQLQSADLIDAQLQSAYLGKAQLQGVELGGIQLAGATSAEGPILSFLSFKDRIKTRIGKPPELDNVIFDDDIDLKQWEDQTYTVEQAEKWIKEGDLIYFMSVSK